MLSYHNNPLIKQTILDQLQGHYEADEIIRGVYWQNGKGCAVGCTIHSSNHEEYESRFGIPRALAYLEDRLFEGLPNNLAKTWPLRFMSAIPIGKDLSLVFHQFSVWLLINPQDGMISLVEKDSPQEKCIIQVAALHQDIIDGIRPTVQQWSAAATYDYGVAAAAAYDAAINVAAAAAYDAAVYAAIAATYTTASAIDVADVSAYAATINVAAYAVNIAFSAYDVTAFFIKMSDKIISLLENV